MKAIVITTIFDPTSAVKKFVENGEAEVFIVGDKKTPRNWSYTGTRYISIENQEDCNFSLGKRMPYNHYCRKMIGYLWAIKEGAEFIADSDDDNEPYKDWKFPDFEGIYSCVKEDNGFVNVYQWFTEQKIWPRGLPLQLINNDATWASNTEKRQVKIGVWQGLADEDPDVDAIYRLTDGRPCFFEKKDSIVLAKGTLCPFNTQNTFIRKELFPLMYLPTYVTFRYTDILRGLVAQPIMWLYDYLVGFTSATVIQKRNPHDFFNDFLSEIPMYQTTEKVIELVSKSIFSKNSIYDNLYNSYVSLLNAQIVEKKELENLEAWIADIQKIL